MSITGRTLVRFCGALVLGLGATAIDHPGSLAWLTLRRVETMPVVVAARDVPEGAVIDRTSLVVASWPAATIPAGAYTSVDSVAGRVARVALYNGEAIVPGRLAPTGTGAGLEVKITPGKRAYGIRVDHATSLAGLIQPNSRVDIAVVMYDSVASRRVAKLFMSNVRVLAIGTVDSNGKDRRPMSVVVATVEVTPEEAESLAIAAAHGPLQLMLRGYGDPDSISNTVAPTRDLLLRRYQPSRTSPPDSVRLTVRRGPR